MRPQVGQVISNKYRLIRLIGDGGMGSVYEARHEGLGTTVALKFLHPELSRRSGLVQRFLQEARVSAQIHSPHVVRVSDVDQGSGGLAFIVMEYLEGRTLQTLYEDLYKAGVRLSYADALEYAMQMLEGVEAAHRANIVHRDLKPDNVIITQTSKGAPLLKLLDFGIAKLRVTGQLDRGLTRPGVIMGTPEYMAPEQAYSADAVDGRADIFSLGVMIFEMLAGRRPVGGDDPHQIASSYLSGQISQLSDLAPSLAPELCAAVHRAMSPLAGDRFPAVHDFREALDPFARAAKAPSAMTPAPSAVTPAPSVVAAAKRGSDPAPAVIPPTSAGAGPASSPDGASPAGAAVSAAPHEPSAVPKTIPPEDEAHAPVAAGPAAPPTPLGGFAADTGASASSSPGVTPEPQRTPSPGHAAAPVIVQGARPPPTVSAAPYAPPNGAHGGSTEAASPIDVSPRAPRPGGTAVGMPIFADAAEARPAPSPGYGGTAPMDPLPATVSAAPYAGTPAPSRDAKSGGPPLLLILLLAAGIAGASVGGLYIAHEFSRTEEQTDVAPPPPQPAATLPSAPQPPTTSAADPTTPTTTKTTPPRPTTTPPKPTTTTTPPKPTTTTTTTPPKPTTTTTTTPPPSTTTQPQTPPTMPTLPPIIMPSTLPWQLPIPITPPSNPPPPPTATTTTSKRPGGIPILIPR